MKIRLWGTLLADVVIQMLGTDYARILRAIYAFAQVYKHGKLDVLIPIFFIIARMVLTFFKDNWIPVLFSTTQRGLPGQIWATINHQSSCIKYAVRVFLSFSIQLYPYMTQKCSLVCEL